MEKRLSNPKAICEICGNVHIGRVPKICKEKEKGRSKLS